MTANQTDTTAIGRQSQATAQGALAVGTVSQATGDAATAVGNGAQAEGNTATALGGQAIAVGDSTVAVGQGAGAGSTTANTGSVAMGIAAGTLVGGAQNTAVGGGVASAMRGAGSGVTGTRNIAMGTGDGSVAYDSTLKASAGDLVTGNDNIAIGTNAGIGVAANATTSIGFNAMASATNAVAIGTSATASNANDVALGSGSSTTAPSTGPYTIITGNTTVAGTPVATNGVVSVGAAGKERQIQNVAAGTVNATSTNAVNGSQLYAVGSQVNTNTTDLANLGNSEASGMGGTSSYDATTGSITTRLSVGGTTYTNVNSAIDAVNATASEGWNLSANGGTAVNIAPGATVDVAQGDNIEVTQNAANGNLTIATSLNPSFTNVTTTGNMTVGGAQTVAGSLTVNGPVVAHGGLGVGAGTSADMGGNVVTNVGAGAVGPASTDGVNGSQLYQVQQTANAGWNVTTAATGTGVANTPSAAKVAPGATATITAGNNVITTQNGTSVAIGVNPVLAGLTSIAFTGGGPSLSTAGVDMGNTKITNLAPGTNPTDAVNVSQLDTLVAGDTTHYYDVNDGGTHGGNFNNDGATGTNSLAAGVGASATATNAVSIGFNAISQGGAAVSIGGGNTANGDGAVTIGGGSANTSIGPGVLAIGNGNTAGNTAGATLNPGGTSGAVALGSGNIAGDSYISRRCPTPGVGCQLFSAGNGAVAIGANNNATGAGAVALGFGSKANSGLTSLPSTLENVGPIAIGYQASANRGSIALGTNAYGSQQAIAVGLGANSRLGSLAMGQDANGFRSSVVLGQNASGQWYSVALGLGAQADVVKIPTGGSTYQTTSDSIAIGRNAVANMTALGDGGSMIAIGNGATVRRTAGIALGNAANVSAADGMALGVNAAVSGQNGIAAGNGAQAQGADSISMGTGSVVSGAGSGAFGDPNNVTGNASYAFGNDNTVAANNAFVLGSNVTIAAGLDGAVALGNDSVVAASTIASYNPGTGTIFGTSIGSNVVSVGASGAERRITNVAAGGAPTDAVNVSQLQSLQSAVAAGETHYYSVNDGGTQQANYDNDGATGTNAIAAGPQAQAAGAETTAVGSHAIAGTHTVNGATTLTKGDTAIGARSVAYGGYGTAAGYGSSATGAGGSALGHLATAGAIHSVALGESSAVAEDADAGVAIGWGSFVTPGATSAMALGAGSLALNPNDVALGAGSVTGAANPTANVVINGTTYTFAGTAPTSVVSMGAAGTERQVTNVAAGRITDTSTDAINGSQLYATNQAVTAMAGELTHDYSVNSSNPGTDTNYGNAGATGADALAAGVSASATAGNATALGAGAQSTIDGAVALGSGAVSDRALAPGSGLIGGTYIPYNTTDRTLLGAVSVGSSTTFRQITNVADGTESNDAVTLRQLTGALQSFATTTTEYFHANSTLLDSVAVGTDSIAVGPTTVVNGDNGIGMGFGATVMQTAPGGTAIGQDAVSNQADSIALGTRATASGIQSISLGAGASTATPTSVAIGAGASAGAQPGDVALGANATTSTVVGTTGATIGGIAYAFAGGNPTSTVSVGSAGNERTITNVAAGRISDTSTDAINGSQLNATNQAVNVLDAQVTTNTGDINNLQNQVNNINQGKGGQFQTSADSTGSPSPTGSNSTAGGANAAASGSNSVAVGNDSKASGDASTALGEGAQATADNSVAIGTGSVAGEADSVSVGSAGNERKITNVAAGSAPTDAVNVSQLQASQQGGVHYDTNTDGSTDYNSVTLNPGGTGPTVIHNVAAGTANNDAVNVGQLNTAIAGAASTANNYTDQRYNELKGSLTQIGNRANAGIASAIAAASLPQPYAPNQSSLGVGLGSFRGEAGIAVGMSKISESGRFILKANVSSDTRGDVGAGVGAGIVW